MRAIVVIAAILAVASTDGDHHAEQAAVPLAANLAANHDKLMAIPSAPEPVFAPTNFLEDSSSSSSYLPSAPAADPVTTFSQAAAAPLPHYSQPPAPVRAPTNPQYPTEQSYYYYYYPVEAPKDKSFWNKMMDKLYITKLTEKFSALFAATERQDQGLFTLSDPATIAIITAVVVVAAIVLLPTTITLVSFAAIKAKIAQFFEGIANKAGLARDMEFTVDDMIFFVNRVYEAINKKY